jgi:DNA transformation protein
MTTSSSVAGKMPGRSLRGLKNLGPASERQLSEVGIRTEAELRAIGAVPAWRRLKFRFPREITTVMLYALEGALRDCAWNRLPPEVREALREEAHKPG